MGLLIVGLALFIVLALIVCINGEFIDWVIDFLMKLLT